MSVVLLADYARRPPPAQTAHRKARRSSAAPSRGYHRPWARITRSASQARIRSTAARSAGRPRENDERMSIGALPSGSRVPATGEAP